MEEVKREKKSHDGLSLPNQKYNNNKHNIVFYKINKKYNENQF